MGYFSNGFEGECYYEEYCSRCIHDDPDNGKHCPIWGLHLLHNYEECNKKDSFLHVLIPRNGICNDTCTMFVERPAVGDLFPQTSDNEHGKP